ncbi:4Fe-4S binding protein [bacterium]|nr:4Fe-4S binding protein [bacterium]
MSDESVVTKKRKKAPPIITINKDWCKSCEICVEFCPTHVLEMQGFYPVVAHIDQCTACMLCEYRCPDFAITVEKAGADDNAAD